jgi:Tfp pilus assembly protein PilN
MNTKTISSRCDESHEMMKEIDFLPDWYKTGQKRQVNYRTQCIALSGVFLVMIVWSLVAPRSISNAKAELTQLTAQHDQAEKASTDLVEMRSDLKGLQVKIQSIEEIDSKIDVASILAEISSLVDEMVVLRKIEFIAEKFGRGGETETSLRANAAVRVAQSQFANKKDLPLGRVRFKVTIAGVAADAGDVAALISRLENSPYFHQVILSFSRNAQVGTESTTSLYGVDVVRSTLGTGNRAGASGGKLQVSEFQINCFLGNYREL